MRVLVCLIAGFASAAAAQTTGDVQIYPVRGSISMLVGAGANITVSVGQDGVLMVDAGAAGRSDQVLAAIRRIQTQTAANGVEALRYGAEGRSAMRAIVDTREPAKPIRYLIDTSVDGDHAGGNEAIAKIGKTFTGGNVAGNLTDAAQGAAVFAHETVLNRMTEAKVPFGALPTDTYHVEFMNLSHYMNGEGVQMIHMPAAHSDGDTMVWFRGSDVISTGDVFTPDRYPMIDLQKGGSIQGEIDALNRLLDMTIPEFRLEGGTMVIPGHGHLCDAADVAYYRDMTTIIRDRIQALIRKDLTLEQVKAAKPTLDYDGIYGATSGPVDYRPVHRSRLQKLEPEEEMKIAILIACASVLAGAQGRAPQTAKAAAPIELTGYYVSVVTEDWRFRMMTPAKGDYPSIPLNAEGRKIADSWDAAKDEAAGEACKGYGAGNILRMPGRIHISWQDDNTLKVETDTGMQTRLFHFGRVQPPTGAPDWQGFSVAHWELAGERGRGPGGALKAVTTHVRPGYLQKNGVPYSGDAVITEHFDLLGKEPNGDQWLIVTTLVDDPQYLNQQFQRSTHFKRQPDASGWDPAPCSAR